MELESLIRQLLEGLGENPNREGLADTPKRVIKAWREMLSGMNERPEEILKASFHGDGYDQIVALKDIAFWSTCEHHLLPFHGTAAVAYLPRNRVVGLSKMARLVHCFSRRLQIQERMTNEIASSMSDQLQPLGVAVMIKARHLCMSCRGVKQQNAEMITSAVIGTFRENNSAKSEVLRLFGI
jgi:GTP cyclohydrolase IA